MPHLTLEYSANLRAEGDISSLCSKLAQALRTQTFEGKALYPTGGVRVRAIPVDEYCIADGAADAAFLHGTLKIGAGRGEAARIATGDALFDVMKSHFSGQFEKGGMALSLEINEFSESGTWKHNNLHARFKQA